MERKKSVLLPKEMKLMILEELKNSTRQKLAKKYNVSENTIYGWTHPAKKRPSSPKLPFNILCLGKGSTIFDSRKGQRYLQVSINASKPQWVKIPDEPKKGLLQRCLFWK